MDFSFLVCGVMGTRRKTCPNCERLARRAAELEQLLAESLARIAELEKQLASPRPASGAVQQMARDKALQEFVNHGNRAH